MDLDMTAVISQQTASCRDRLPSLALLTVAELFRLFFPFSSLLPAASCLAEGLVTTSRISFPVGLL